MNLSLVGRRRTDAATGTSDPADRRAWVLAAAGTAAFLAVSVRRWQDLRAGASDLGIFDQAVWKMAHGQAPFVTTIGIDVFADHVSPVLLAFVPLYRIAATPIWLLLVQSACLGLTVVPVRRLADELGVARGWATVLVLANPLVWSAAVYDVHPVVFATPAVAWLLLAVRRDDRRAATIAAILVVLCRADAATALLGAAVLAAPVTRRRLLWLAPVPLVAAQVVPHVLGTWQTFERYYGRLGTSPLDAVTHPWRIATVVPTAALQLAIWLLPAGFLPLRRRRWLVATAVAGAPLLVSSWPGIIEPWWHHGALMVGFIAGGALAAMAPEDGQAARHPTGDRIRIAVGTSVALLVASPLAPWAPAEVRLVDVVRPAPVAVADAVAAVGPTDVVSTSNDVAARLGHRTAVYLWPCPFEHPPGTRRCSHRNLYADSADVDVVVLVGERDLSTLHGRWSVTHRDGITVARRI